MRRALLLTALMAVSLFAMGGVAQAQDPPEADVPEAFAPPAPAPVVDVESAQNFLERYAARNAFRFLRQHPRRVRVIDVNAACLEHPIIADRFGCGFTLRALVIQRRNGWWNWGHGSKYHSSKRGKPRFRVRTFGCLGLARVVGGPAVTPSVTVPLVECARAPKGDYSAPEPEPVS